ncbi:hypothetical protein JMJ77_0015185 [Colletotrichum scovillei]|uniref:Uncharacterized protein n=1 Tax=Colletotrichum scovillei TaxID=1209932 RepID=A0A9P7QZQ6_9PEZI|nr:hypothetical protein JMJ77_0015185 [Colletotrichum scovillei]KAG7056806.1 hypothetical protein JMJ78_0000596 [Colletotrichum scovillei]KAG7066736.1 hypothetical protein JMJ76_0000588 [Colletotrichum scovillei]
MSFFLQPQGADFQKQAASEQRKPCRPSHAPG